MSNSFIIGLFCSVLTIIVAQFVSVSLLINTRFERIEANQTHIKECLYTIYPVSEVTQPNRIVFDQFDNKYFIDIPVKRPRGTSK